MNKILEAGTKVKYMVDGHAQEGVVHGVRKAQLPDGSEHVLTYLVDTGEDVRVDVHHRNYRHEEITRRMFKAAQKDNKVYHDTDLFKKTHEKILSASDLPKEGVTIEKVRQPVQVEVRVEDIEAL